MILCATYRDTDDDICFDYISQPLFHSPNTGYTGFAFTSWERFFNENPHRLKGRVCI